MKHLFIVLLIAALLACTEQKHDAIPPGATVLILGDSLSYGTGAGEGEDYPTILADKTRWNIINAGVPGDTTAGGLERLPELLEKYSPDLLLVALGGNDFLKRVPVEQTTSNLRAILSQSKAQDIPAILLGIPEPGAFSAVVGNLSDAAIFEEIAKETNTPIIQDVFSEVLSKNALKSDPIHPNAEGYRMVAAELGESLQELGFLK